MVWASESESLSYVPLVLCTGSHAIGYRKTCNFEVAGSSPAGMGNRSVAQLAE